MSILNKAHGALVGFFMRFIDKEKSMEAAHKRQKEAFHKLTLRHSRGNVLLQQGFYFDRRRENPD